MRNILKGFLKPETKEYIFPDAASIMMEEELPEIEPAEEESSAPAEEPVPDQKKPVPPAESSRDSGRPPIQEQQPLESPFVKFR